MRKIARATLAVALLGSLVPASGVAAAGSPVVEVTPEVRHDTSPPLRGMQPASPTAHQLTEHPIRLTRSFAGPDLPDGALQSSPAGPAAPTTPGLGFAGVGNGDYGFAPDAAPPDTNGAVGATQYVQWVNESFAVFDKSTGAKVLGPLKGNSLWAGFGGDCQANNDGDPIVQYDKAAGRWVMTQFSVSTTPYLECVAVSQTSDATGAWNRYAFSYGTTQFNDYPKLSVWPDAYYVTYNIFTNAQSYAGPKACALDRAAMIAGTAATQQCVQLGSSVGPLLPSDLDGSTAPAASEPNYLLTMGTNTSLNLYKFKVNWATPASTTLTGPTAITVPSYTLPCNGGGTCITQPSTSQRLDSLGDRLMYRLAFRKTADGVEHMVVNHSVKVSGNNRNQVVGVRWYELRSPDNGATWSRYQSGTYSPDSTNRWMGSVAMDKNGSIAVGYSASSGSVFPSVRYAVRAPADALGTLTSETIAKAGGGSQLANLSRWGDYSAMTVDPVNDCTFWFTTEYQKANGTFNWSTWITSFKVNGCQ